MYIICNKNNNNNNVKENEYLFWGLRWCSAVKNTKKLFGDTKLSCNRIYYHK